MIMLGILLSVGTVVQCSHGDVGHCPMPNPRVEIMGQPIVLQSIPYIVDCPIALTGGIPCVTAQWAQEPLALRLTKFLYCYGLTNQAVHQLAHH